MRLRYVERSGRATARTWNTVLAVTERPDIDRLVLSAWQQVDDAHPAGGGRPAYRVVYKTLRVIVGEGVIRFPNLHLRFGHGNVERGGVNLDGAVRGRRRGNWYLP